MQSSTTCTHTYMSLGHLNKSILFFFFFKSAVRTPIQSRPKLSHTRTLLLSKPAGLAESLGHTRITMPCMTSSVVGHMHMRTVHCTRRRVRTCMRQPFCLRALHCIYFAQPIRPRNLLHYRRELACDVCQCQAQLRV